MAIMFKIEADGGFLAGDTATGRTMYAYPTSPAAEQGARSPLAAAGLMLDRWWGPVSVDAHTQLGADLIRQHIAHWARLGATTAPQLPYAVKVGA